MNSQITKASEVRQGDLVTETDTPDGPFYRVLKVNPKSLVLDASGDPSDPLPVRLPFGPTHAVRVAV